jgi:acyl-CoA dehydrogenase
MCLADLNPQRIVARMSLDPVLAAVLQGPSPAPVEDVDGWWLLHVAAVSEAPQASSVDRAIRAAARMDRLGYAFASGYVEALRQLVPEVGTARVALCATEEGGGHPRAIATRLAPDGDGWRMSGTKSWVTLGSEARQLVVVASLGVEDGRNRLRVVRVPASREGVGFEALPPTPFVPELPHARLELTDVRVEPREVLEGDGYSRYLKPFRTVEDVHVHAAALALVLGLGVRGGWDRGLLAELTLLLQAARSLATCDPTDPTVHLALGGLIDRSRALVLASAPSWEHLDPDVRRRLERDLPLLDVASTARGRRLERAWELVAVER